MSDHEEKILHVTVVGVYHFNDEELAATLRRLADQAENGGINNSQPADVAVTRSNPGGGGPCRPNQIAVDVSLVPPNPERLPTAKQRSK